jgi:hypothetical protein
LGQIALLQPEFVEPAPDHERNIHWTPPGALLGSDTS